MRAAPVGSSTKLTHAARILHSIRSPYLYDDTTTLSLDLASGVRVLTNLATGQHMDIAAILTIFKM